MAATMPSDSLEDVATFERALDELPLPIVAARPAGALFSATTRMANPSQRPRAWLTVVLNSMDGSADALGNSAKPSGGSGGFSGPATLVTNFAGARPTTTAKTDYGFMFVIRTSVTPSIRLSERSVRRLLEWLESTDAAVRTTVDYRSGETEFVRTPSGGDRVTCSWHDHRVTFERAELAARVRMALKRVDEINGG